MKNGTRVRISRFRPAAALKISGEDALPFLQGQFTQDLKTLGQTSTRYGLWLNQKGKVLADSFILNAAGGGFWILSYFSPAAVIRERLESYIIADDVEIEDQTDAWSGITVIGDGGPGWLRERGIDVSETGSCEKSDGELIWSGRRAASKCWDWLMPAEKAAAVDLGGALLLSDEELESIRIEDGIPAVPREVGPGDLPNEAGLERDAISYAKGCYLGQEVMARLKAMGQVRRRLVRVRGVAPAPEARATSLFFGDKRVGELRSAVRTEAGWVGFAMVNTSGLTPAAVLSLSLAGTADIRMEFLTHE
jgi:tRNA-modifying protein YgfZ